MFAYSTIVYAVACVLYMVRTRNANTPFLDSLTVPQRKIYKDSCKVRLQIFATSTAMACVLVWMWRPFRHRL